ncbi:MAG: hypothetical protein JXR05_12470 [Flavobacteriaceae bacterium]
MKQIFLKAFTVFLIMGMMASCTQNDEDIDELLMITEETEACCGTGEFDPPPPPPPPPGGGTGG